MGTRTLLYHPESECAWWAPTYEDAQLQIEQGDGLIEIVMPEDPAYQHALQLARSSERHN